MPSLKGLAFVLVAFLLVSDTVNRKTQGRAGKVLSLFRVVQFPNAVCDGGTRNGTCYTNDECRGRGGLNSGTCASGYGVCCIISLACGAMSAENCTYLVQTSVTNLAPNPCKYKICPCDDSICRIRFDFDTFMLNGPVEGTALLIPPVLPLTGGAAIGDCTTDSFTVTAPGSFSPPLICGFNSGQHMIVDASPGRCHEISFDLSGTGTRSWDIKVTQYQCGNEQGGPPGCLQYFTGTTGTVASFNFPTTAQTVDPSTTHLSSQCYTMCWRQEMNACAICWIPVVLGTQKVTGSFGLSNSAGVPKTRGESDGKCRSDYLQIPDAQVDVATHLPDTFVIGPIPATTMLSDRVCGRFFSTADLGADRQGSLSICTQQRPFRMTFKTDPDEVTLPAPLANPGSAEFNELNKLPGGIVGFNLKWTLQTCT